MQIGFIGLGTMGQPVAQHLMRHGHAMGVYARRAAALDPLLAAGAVAYQTPRELAAHSDVVFTMVTATADVEEVLFAHTGIAAGGRRGLTVVDMSTIAPAAAREFAARLAERGIALVDAPVSGGPEGARNGTLTIMAGGSPESFDRVRPLFECFGATILHLGAAGAGQTTKACHQLLLLITAEGAAEALTLARRSGVDPVMARQAMMSGIAASRVLDRFGARMAQRQFAAGIPARIYRKDLQIVLDLAREARVSLPAGELTMQHILELVERGRGDEDLSALITVVEGAGRSEEAAGN
jgi:2-hydroxy-3-oxopropionate reductase